MNQTEKNAATSDRPEERPDKYTTESSVRYQDTDSELRATPVALMGAMQEAAILQSEHVGRGIEWLSNRDQVWMIVQTLIRIDRLPRWRDRISVTTWPSEMGRLLSRREFLLRDHRGLFARATTLWAFVETQERKVIRVPKELAEAYSLVEERAIDGTFPRPPRCTDPLKEVRLPIRRSDIDSNGHVNNLRYLSWLLDSLPDELPTRAELSELNIRFQKETGPQGSVTTRCADLGDTPDGRRRFSHEITHDQSGERLVLGQTTWR